MNNYIPYGRQDIDEDDINTVVQILKSEWLTQGPVIDEFEQTTAALCDAKYAVACTSATAALHIACLAIDMGPGDILWTSPNTFVASSNCALYCGASVDFVDIDEKTYNMSVSALEEKLAWAKKHNKLPKAIVLVHFAGQSCDMKAIKMLTEPYGIKLIEDASHAIGSRYLESKVGSCQYSDIAIFSFHPVKIITTGEGGMLLTNSESIMRKAQLFRSHGITRNQDLMKSESEGPWYYEQIALGYNFRITDIQAGLGLSQLKRIKAFVQRRRELAKNYDSQLATLPVVTPWQSEDCLSAYHLYPIQLELDKMTKSRRVVFDELRKANIGVNVHYIPVHMQPYYQALGFKKGAFPRAESYYERAISLPLHYRMTDKEQSYVVEILSSILKQE
jgi:UDP-4-amino-4,6-dideoxy-N-acetyl-beta-L-altrosamine transaminase